MVSRLSPVFCLSPFHFFGARHRNQSDGTRRGVRWIVAAAISGSALSRGSPLDPGIMRPAIRNAVAIAALVALLGTIGEYFVRQGILRAAAQGLSAPLSKLR